MHGLYRHLLRHSDAALGVNPLCLSKPITEPCLRHPCPIVELLCKSGKDLHGLSAGTGRLVTVEGPLSVIWVAPGVLPE